MPAQNFGEFPKVMIRCILMEKCTECPKIAFRFTQNGQQKTINFQLPVLINKYIEPVEMTNEKFEQVWVDINRPDFQKLDLILKNPAPSTVSIEDVLKKMANLL